MQQSMSAYGVFLLLISYLLYSPGMDAKLGVFLISNVFIGLGVLFIEWCWDRPCGKWLQKLF